MKKLPRAIGLLLMLALLGLSGCTESRDLEPGHRSALEQSSQEAQAEQEAKQTPAERGQAAKEQQKLTEEEGDREARKVHHEEQAEEALEGR